MERYEGIVLDFEGIPSCSKELTDAEQKVPSPKSYLYFGSDLFLRLQLYNQASLNSRRPSISHTLSEHRRDDHLRRGTVLNGDGGEPTGLGILGRRGTGDGLSLATSGKGFGSFLANGPLSPMKDRFVRRGLSLSRFSCSFDPRADIWGQILVRRGRHTDPDSSQLVQVDLREIAMPRCLPPEGLARSASEAGRPSLCSLLGMGGEEDAKLGHWRMLDE